MIYNPLQTYIVSKQQLLASHWAIKRIERQLPESITLVYLTTEKHFGKLQHFFTIPNTNRLIKLSDKTCKKLNLK